jgi:TolB protein
MRARTPFAVALLMTVAAVSLGPAVAAAPLNGRIAFARDSPHQIFAMAPDGTDLTRLTISPMPNWDPAWSADGTRIAFVRAKPGWKGSKLMLMLADGSAKSVVFRSRSDLYGPDWFPDGAHIVLSRDANGILLRTRLMIAATDGSTFLTVGPRGASDPSVSPDGSKIAFTRYSRGPGGNWNVWVMNADGSGRTQITTDGRSTSPVWSPDGAQIVFVRRVKSPSDPWRQTDVFVMSADGSNRVRLTNSRRWEYAPTWSPDGTLILFEQTTYWDEYASTDLWTMMPDGSNRTKLLDTPGVHEYRPDWQAV